MLTSTQYIFLAIVGLFIIQRLLELRHSRRNEQIMRNLGGRGHTNGHSRLMTAVHTLWFISMIAEVIVFDRRLVSHFDWALAGSALIVTCAGQSLRYAAIRTLGQRWSVRIFTVPNSPAVTGGIYRYIRHPNYLGVILEIAAVPLLHGAYFTAAVFTALNALVLWIRIRAEERALRDENEYETRMLDRARFVPRVK